MYIYQYTYLFKFVYIYIYLYLYTYVYVCMFTCTDIYIHIYYMYIICIYICTGQPAAPSRSPQPHVPLKHQRELTDCPSKCTRDFQGGVAAPSITYFSHIKTRPHAPLKHQRKSVNTLNTLIVHAQMHTEGVDRCASVNTLSVHLEGQSDCPSKCTRGFQGGVSAPLITYFSHIKTRPRYKDREKVGEFE